MLNGPVTPQYLSMVPISGRHSDRQPHGRYGLPVQVGEVRAARAQQRERWLLPLAALLVPLAMLVSLPMAFGMSMASWDSSGNGPNPHLRVLVSLLGCATVSLIAALISRSLERPRSAVALCAIAVAASGAIILGFAAETGSGFLVLQP